jgi:hypothetical protein
MMVTIPYFLEMILSQHAFKSILFIHENKKQLLELKSLSLLHTKQHEGNFHLHTYPDLSGTA